MTDKPCPRCINGPMPTWGNVDQVWYCDHHVGEIMRKIARKAGSVPKPRRITNTKEGITMARKAKAKRKPVAEYAEPTPAH